MTTLTRKQREIQHREQQILQLALAMLLRDGYHGLSMDRIAEQLEYSKGTIYNHFACKEEILLALMEQTAEKRLAMFRRAAVFRGDSRARIQAVGAASELFVRLFPEHFQVEQVVRSSSVWEKASEQRRTVVRSCEQRCMELVAGIVRDAVAAGDLELPAGLAPEDLVFGLWSMTHGAYTLISTSQALGELGIGDPFAAVRHHLETLLDGYAWRPTNAQRDPEQTRVRVFEEVFADECKQLGSP